MADFKKIGEDVLIDPTARITRPQLLELGSHIGIDMGVYISTGGSIGDWIHIAPYTCIIGGADAEVILEDFSGISSGCKLVCISDDFNHGLISPIVPAKYRKTIGGKIHMKKYSLIGVNSVIMPGVTMAEGSVLGANSLLLNDTEPWTIYVGSPAKPLKARNKEQYMMYVEQLLNEK